MKTHYHHSPHRGILTSLALLLLMVAGGTGWLTWQTMTATAPPAAIPSPVEKPPTAQQPEPQPAIPKAAPFGPAPSPTQPAPRPDALQQHPSQPQIYWLQGEGREVRLHPQPVALNAAVAPEQALMEGMINLLSHPQVNHSDNDLDNHSGNDSAQDLESAIPSGTRLLGLHITPTGVQVNVSREFSQGGGSRSMIYRVAQILYTATSLNPEAPLYLSVEGQLLDEDHPLGGEGLLLRQPLTRRQFAEDFSLF